VRGRGGGAGAFFNDIDVENEMEFLAATDVVPDVVKTFVTYFYSHIRDRNVFEIMNAYDTAWNNLSERYFKISSWPPAEIIAGLVDNDAVFLLLYKEMYYRHIYSKLEPTLEQRCESWDNYCALFNIFLQGNVNMQLPLQWLWDMIDEFGYQFQSFSQYRAKLKNKTADELALLAECGGVWNVLSVLNYLKAMVDNSDIINKFRDPTAYGADLTPAELAEALNDGWDPCNQATHSNVLPALGYFAQVGLARVHSLLGDYHTALAKVDSLDLSHPRASCTPSSPSATSMCSTTSGLPSSCAGGTRTRCARSTASYSMSAAPRRSCSGLGRRDSSRSSRRTSRCIRSWGSRSHSAPWCGRLTMGWPSSSERSTGTS